MIKKVTVNLQKEAIKLVDIGFHKGVCGALESIRKDLIEWIKDVENGKKPAKSILKRFDVVLKEQQKELKKFLKGNKIVQWWTPEQKEFEIK